MDEILKVENLSVQFNNKKGLFSPPSVKKVLNNVCFGIKNGEIVGLLGESGSGKSTIAKAILGMVPYTGKITHGSAKPQMVFQDPYSSLNPSKKVGWLLKEALYLDGERDKEVLDKAASDMINMVGLSDEFLIRYPNELSGGQRQRVCIGLSLMQNPKLLIADEPVSALDVTIQAQILKLLDELQEKMGLSILFISHDLRVVYNVCDRVLVLKNGVIVEEGDPKEVYSSPKHEYTKQLLDSL